MTTGIVYILINEAMPGLTKIGKTVTSIEQRMRELDSTGVPLPFECFHASQVNDMNFVERQLHDAFDDTRVRQRREFFKISPERVRSALVLAQIEDVTPREDVVEDADDQAALDHAREWRAPFSFNMVDIPAGAVLTFSKDPDVTCVVRGNKKIEFDGEITSVSAAASKALARLGMSWKSVQGPIYWLYEGETLDERRRRMEESDD